LPISTKAGQVQSAVDNGSVRDAGMLAAAQAVEHYEIARYGTLIAWAEKLKMPQAAQLLQKTLQEEKQTDALLSELAYADINTEAVSDEDGGGMANKESAGSDAGRKGQSKPATKKANAAK
jgi:ferritin-like metal-binding protein YciE